jgi:hypothetical protein
MPTEVGPSSFNPNAQMVHFLRAMGLRYDELARRWRMPDDPTWTQEELERMWSDAHPLQQP